MKFKHLITATSLLLASASANSAVIFYTGYSAFDSATSTTLIEDFEGAPSKDTPLRSLYSNGISYTPISPTTNVWVSSPGYTNYGITGATTSSILTATGDENFLITPDAALSAIGFDIYLNGFVPAYVKVNGTSGLMDTFDLTTLSSSEVGFLGIASTEGITSVEWFTTKGGVYNTGIDNVRTQKATGGTGPMPVPEPASIALMGLGLLGLGAMRRKRK